MVFLIFQRIKNFRQIQPFNQMLLPMPPLFYVLKAHEMLSSMTIDRTKRIQTLDSGRQNMLCYTNVVLYVSIGQERLAAIAMWLYKTGEYP